MTIQDIKSISGDFVNGSFDLLPISFDRIKATKYFCNKIQELTALNNDVQATWYFRAALGEFRSSLEAIGADIKQIAGSNTWKDSCYANELDNHPLIKILTKVRNFSVHSSRLSGNPRDYLVERIESEGSHIEQWRSLFIDQLNKKTNVKGISNVPQAELNWFNRQSEKWPANLIIHSAIYEGSKFVRAFITTIIKSC